MGLSFFKFLNLGRKPLFIFLILPHILFALSETELESLKEGGSKTISESPWRFSFGLSISRNLHLETRHKVLENSNATKEGSLWDRTNFYYNPRVTIYYSLRKLKPLKDYSFLKNTELFVSSGFFSNFAEGTCSSLKGSRDKETDQVTLKSYIRCGIQNIILGSTTPLYQKDEFFSFLDLNALIYPLSKRSEETSLKSYIEASLSFLYYMKKEEKWSLAFSTSHYVTLNHFEFLTTKSDASNRPFDTTQGLSFILQQNWSPYLPTNSQISTFYTFAVDTYKVDSDLCDAQSLKLFQCGSKEHYLSLNLNSSWKIFKRTFLGLSFSWRDLIGNSNPLDENVIINHQRGFQWKKWTVSASASYSF